MAHDPEAEQGNTSPLYPIREVSRLTGVNTVTLRAWERRYGLITPQRTPKGHRLYSTTDIENVRRILQWMDKGVTISQVGDLLDQPPEANRPIEPAGDWQALREQFQQTLQQLDEDALDRLFCDAFTRWPASQLADDVFSPLLRSLPTDSASYGLLIRYLRNRIGERLQNRRKLLAGPRLLLLRTGEDQQQQLLTLLALSDLDFEVFWLDQAIHFNELLQVAVRLKPRLLLLGSGDYSQQQLQQLKEKCSAPCVETSQLEQINSVTLYGLLRDKT
ncbi:MAG: MerR family transcriptional regulator [Marinospirillum sp.]|uniref:MerR family transcriptional regulator n=1 Tax=Marinospirillum sp. TaxID=2183934 RepID=UPI0019FBFABD|nr:MerR family transcriptional regulator [Marinospirillum sp.]MBE0508013.1 MerR family transcriptional regulator [Marinospirillum sp.]